MHKWIATCIYGQTVEQARITRGQARARARGSARSQREIDEAVVVIRSSSQARRMNNHY